MNLSLETISIFERVFHFSEEVKSLFSKPALLAYSGGKDSTLVLELYHYLYNKYKIPTPWIFHLDHQIRDNANQERDIQKYLAHFPFLIFSKKKTSQN